MDIISSMMAHVDQNLLSANLFHLAKDPLPCRTLNTTLPGHSRSTLYEADDFIRSNLESWGYRVEREGVDVQAFRTDTSKPLPHQFSRPEPSDPWYQAYNLYAKKLGTVFPDELILVIAHKDSQSWIELGPGANDNCAGTVAVMEIARVLAGYTPQRSIWFMFCNEEHWPWTSITAAQNLAQSDMNVVVVLNVDSIGSKSEQDRHDGRMVNVTRYTAPEGERLAALMVELNEKYGVGLIQSTHRNPRPGNDDGSFIKAGIPVAIQNGGSVPSASPYYHTRDDIPEHVDVINVHMATKLSVAAVLHLDLHG